MSDDQGRNPETRVSAGLLRRWAEALAEVGRDEPERVAAALGLRLRPGWLGYAEVLDPPPGVELLVLLVDDGKVRAATIELNESQRVTAQELDAAFGSGEDQPILHPGSGTPRAYPPFDGARARIRPTMEVGQGVLTVARFTIEPY